MAPAGQRVEGFESELQELARITAEMGGLAENQIAEAIECLTRRDIERARRLVEADGRIDLMHRAVQERAVECIGRLHPVASDLRHVVGILRIANELERIGDLAKNISKRIIAIKGEEMPRRPILGVEHMATLMLTQLHDVLDSYVRRDVRSAIEIWTRDQDVDRLCTSLFREILIRMRERPATIAASVHLLFCIKNLERMGDHTTNIAESIHYMFTGDSLSSDRPKADGSSALTFASIGSL